MDYSKITQERKRLGLSQEALAARVGVSQKSISKYERGTRRPTYETLTAMAAVFNVSLDYLLSNSDEKQINTISTLSADGYYQKYQERLSSVLTDYNISEELFFEQTGITFNQEPSIDDLIKISQTFHISVDYLLGLSKKKLLSSDSPFLTPREQNVIETLRILNNDNKDIVIGEMKKILKEQRLETAEAQNHLKKTGTTK